MKNALRAFGRAFLSALALSLIFGFVSCKTDDDETESVSMEITEVPSALIGKWKAAYGDVYVISDNSFVSYSSDGADASYTLNFLGAAEVKNTEKTTYYLYYKSPETFEYSMVDDGVTYSGTYYTKDYYTAVRVIVESDSVLDICCAAKSVTYESENASLETVVSDFTISNGYFGSNTEYTKVTE